MGQNQTSAGHTVDAPPKKGWFAGLFGDQSSPTSQRTELPVGIARKQLDELSGSDKSKLDGYFVRIRYNDKVMSVPGCKPDGKHLEGDESFCTLVSKTVIGLCHVLTSTRKHSRAL